MEDLAMNSQFWKGKKVLLTGHTGFKGSWLSLWLQKLGSDLIGFSNSIPTKPSLFELANVQDGMNSIMGDVCDLNHLKRVISEYQPEIVFHMAAQSLVHESYKNPVETYATNVMGTINLFEAIRTEGNVHAIVNITSDKCYENKGGIQAYKETDPMGGYDPYSSSKGCAEIATSSFRNSFFNPAEYEKHKVALASVRAGNVIGGGDWSPYRLIPDIVRGIIESHTVKIRNPDSIRPWQYVMDPLNGYLILAEKLWENGPKYMGGWNFGPNDNNTKPVSWIVEKISQFYGKDFIWQLTDENFKHEATYLKLDCSKAKEKLGWYTKMNLELALSWTIEWYKQYKQNDDIRYFTEKQIENFCLL
jgi:CDP-glucose 4,6-dehydratase